MCYEIETLTTYLFKILTRKVNEPMDYTNYNYSETFTVANFITLKEARFRNNLVFYHFHKHHNDPRNTKIYHY